MMMGKGQGIMKEARMPSGGGKPKTKKKTPPAMRSGPQRRGRAMGGKETYSAGGLAGAMKTAEPN